MKGVAVPYIIGLLIAVIVLTVAVYLIYVYVVQKSPLECQECGARFAAWCSKCYLISTGSPWSGENKMDEDLKQCVVKCNLMDVASDFCVNGETKCKAVGVPP